MDTDDLANEGATEPEPEGTPAFVTREELESRDAQWKEALDRERETNQRLLTALENGSLNRGGYQPQPPIQAGPDPDAPSEDDDEDTKIQKSVRRALKPIVAEFNQFRSVGLGTLSKISERQVVPNLKYYERFRGEIENYLAQADPATRAQPESIIFAYQAVVGKHADELMTEAIDADRKATVRGETVVGSPTSRSSRNAPVVDKNKIPTPEDLGFTEGQIAAIETRGGPDAYARRMSGGRYKGWADFAKAHQKMHGKPEA